METIERIAEDLRGCGVRPGGVLLVHSSLKSLGHVPGGPETVVRGLLEALRPEGTLLMPALSYATVDADHPFFDVRATPSCVGAIPEHFRTRPGTLRSAHPTHSVSGVGPLAEELLSDHHLDSTPVGPNSPFRRLRDRGGQVLFLGCGMGPNTSMHGVEEIAGCAYLFGKTIAYQLTLADGRRITMPCRRHSFGGWKQRYDRLEDLLDDSALKVGKVLRARAHLVEAAAMWEVALAAYRRDPLHFVQYR
jgi:aminoglycoside 3-N-acetyltransferase